MTEVSQRVNYPAGQKEKVLSKLQTPLSAEDQEGVLFRELFYIAQGLTSPDFLEILSTIKLQECLTLFRKYLVDFPFLFNLEKRDLTKFDRSKRKKFSKFIQDLSRLAETDSSPEKLSQFLMKNKKKLGFSQSPKELLELADLYIYLNDKGLIAEDNMSIVHYAGSFSPFPHKGHINVARFTQRGYSKYLSRLSRTVITTTKENSTKPALASDFPQRLDNLHRGFFYENYSSVLGLEGDFKDRVHRIQQLNLIAHFDSDQTLRFVLGSDVFLKRANDALAGDEYAQFILREDHHIILSPRQGDNFPDISRVIAQVQSEFSSQIFLVETTTEDISGTQIRTLSPSERKVFIPNSFVSVL
jgi:nicotinic acid mononucleotide adenylyltransferase